MRETRTRACAAVALAAAGAALAAAPAPAGRSDCSAFGSRTARSVPAMRVYYTARAAPVVCWRPSGRRTRLDRNVDRFYAPRDARLGLLRFAREVLAYTWVDPGAPAVYVHSVNARRGRSLRRAKLEPRIVIEPSAVAVTDLVANRDGSLAWVQRVDGDVSVWRLDRRGRRRLDLSREIGLTSLGLRGTRVTWLRAGARRSAALR